MSCGPTPVSPLRPMIRGSSSSRSRWRGSGRRSQPADPASAFSADKIHEPNLWRVAKALDPTNHFALYPSLRDRVTVVTGGASGLGAAMVEQFALQGSRVAFLDIARELAAELVNRLGAVPHAPLFLSCDVTDIAALRAALGEVERRLGTVRVLVNNAASDDRHDFGRVT